MFDSRRGGEVRFALCGKRHSCLKSRGSTQLPARQCALLDSSNAQKTGISYNESGMGVPQVMDGVFHGKYQSKMHEKYRGTPIYPHDETESDG